MGPTGEVVAMYLQGNKCPVYEKWLPGCLDCVLPTQSWEMPVKRELPANIGRCSSKLAGQYFHRRANSSRENFLYTFRTSPQGDFALESKLWPANLEENRFRYFFLS